MSSRNIASSSSGPPVPNPPWQSPHTSEGEHSNPGRVEATSSSDFDPSSNDSNPDPSPAQTTSVPAPDTSALTQTTPLTTQITPVTASRVFGLAQTTSIPVQITSAPAPGAPVSVSPTSLAAQTSSVPGQTLSSRAQTTPVPAQATSILAQPFSSTNQTIPGLSYNSFKLPGNECEYQYTSCNECQERDPNYVGCNHPEENEPTRSQDLDLQTAPGTVLKMLRVSALKSLFKENLNDDAKAILYIPNPRLPPCSNLLTSPIA